MKIITALLFVLALNMYLFLGQIGVAAIAVNESIADTPVFFNYTDSFASKFDQGGYTVNTNLTSALPSGEGQIEPETGNFFTDTFATMKNWFLETTGLNYLFGIINAVPNYFKTIFPKEVAFILGVVWHAVTLFLVVSVIRGNY